MPVPLPGYKISHQRGARGERGERSKATSQSQQEVRQDPSGGTWVHTMTHTLTETATLEYFPKHGCVPAEAYDPPPPPPKHGRVPAKAHNPPSAPPMDEAHGWIPPGTTMQIPPQRGAGLGQVLGDTPPSPQAVSPTMPADPWEEAPPLPPPTVEPPGTTGPAPKSTTKPPPSCVQGCAPPKFASRVSKTQQASKAPPLLGMFGGEASSSTDVPPEPLLSPQPQPQPSPPKAFSRPTFVVPPHYPHVPPTPRPATPQPSPQPQPQPSQPSQQPPSPMPVRPTPIPDGEPGRPFSRILPDGSPVPPDCEPRDRMEQNDVNIHPLLENYMMGFKDKRVQLSPEEPYPVIQRFKAQPFAIRREMELRRQAALAESEAQSKSLSPAASLPSMTPQAPPAKPAVKAPPTDMPTAVPDADAAAASLPSMSPAASLASMTPQAPPAKPAVKAPPADMPPHVPDADAAAGLVGTAQEPTPFYNMFLAPSQASAIDATIVADLARLCTLEQALTADRPEQAASSDWLPMSDEQAVHDLHHRDCKYKDVRLTTQPKAESAVPLTPFARAVGGPIAAGAKPWTKPAGWSFGPPGAKQRNYPAGAKPWSAPAGWGFDPAGARPWILEIPKAASPTLAERAMESPRPWASYMAGRLPPVPPKPAPMSDANLPEEAVSPDWLPGIMEEGPLDTADNPALNTFMGRVVAEVNDDDDAVSVRTATTASDMPTVEFRLGGAARRWERSRPSQAVSPGVDAACTAVILGRTEAACLAAPAAPVVGAAAIAVDLLVSRTGTTESGRPAMPKATPRPRLGVRPRKGQGKGGPPPTVPPPSDPGCAPTPE